MAWCAGWGGVSREMWGWEGMEREGKWLPGRRKGEKRTKRVPAKSWDRRGREAEPWAQAPLTARLRNQAPGRSRGRVRPKQDGGPPSLPPGPALPEDPAWSRAAAEGRTAPAAEGERSLQQNFRETLICVLFT